MVTGSRFQVARLYFDEDVDGRLIGTLQQRNYDVMTTVTAGLMGASDEEQLAYANSQQRALITHNIKHFPLLHATWLEAGQTHWGIIILIGHSAVGIWLRRMKNLLDQLSAEALRNQLIFLGADYDSSE